MPKFCKPSIDSGPSRFLYVAGIGHQLGTDIRDVKKVFEAYGELDCDEGDGGVEFVDNTRFCYVCFKSVDAAVAALNDISTKSSIDGLSASKIMVKFAQKSFPVQSPPLPECTSLTKDIDIEGVHIIPDFLSIEDEMNLLDGIASDHGPWINDLNRRVQHYGFIFNYRTLMLDYSTVIPQIPNEVLPIVNNIENNLSTIYNEYPLSDMSSILTPEGVRIRPGMEYHTPLPFTQLTMNEYLPGQGIAAHIDTESCLGPDLAILSIGSDIVMTLQDRKSMSLLLKSVQQNSETVAQAMKSPPKDSNPPVEKPFKRQKSKKKKNARNEEIRNLEIATVDASEEQIGSSISEMVPEKQDTPLQVQDSAHEDNLVVPKIDDLSLENNNSDVSHAVKDNVDLKNEPLDEGDCVAVETSPIIRKKHVLLPRRSLLILRGEARYFWSHAIAPRKLDQIDGQVVARDRRISLTFRQVLLPGEIPSCRLKSSQLENEHVVEVYDTIAVHWNHTRGKRKVHWHRVKDFILGLSPGSLVADIGSGDGKYFGLNPQITVIGCDRSIRLLEVSKESSHNTFCCDAVKIPLRSQCFDATICIAVLHHLSNVDRRIAVIRELIRITRVGGEIMIQAWAKEQEASSRFKFDDPANDSQDILVPWKLNQKYSEEETPQAPATDDGCLLYQRYCHVYKEGELENLCSSVPGNRIIESGWDRGNWFVRLLRVEDPRLVESKRGPLAAMPVLATRI